jgi:hypothetical protein
MSIDMKIRCDMCPTEVSSTEKVPDGWAEVFFRFKYPSNIPEPRRRTRFHVCEGCCIKLYKFMFNSEERIAS